MYFNLWLFIYEMNLIWQAHVKRVVKQSVSLAMNERYGRQLSSFKPSNHISENVYIKTLHKMGNSDAFYTKRNTEGETCLSYVCVLNIAI